jgi:predicted Abi (CAAX) family protease
MLETVIAHTRAELDARDVSAEQQAWRWFRMARWLSGLLVVTLLVIVWLVYERRAVQALVQVVQVEDGRLVQIGVPQTLLAYTPPDGVWYDMLAEWLRRAYWRGEDAHKAEKVDWRWVELHTCPSARAFLTQLKTRLQPGKKTPTRTQVNIRTITKTPTPESYQVLWESMTLSPQSPQGKVEQRTTTFTVGRIDLKTLADAEDNRLGLCVQSFDTAESAD